MAGTGAAMSRTVSNTSRLRILELTEQVARLEGEKAALAAALRQLEWTGRSRVMECPFCEAPFAGGKHRSGCEWVAALSSSGEGTEVREQVREALALFRRWNRGNEKGIKYEDMAMALLEAESALGGK